MEQQHETWQLDLMAFQICFNTEEFGLKENCQCLRRPNLCTLSDRTVVPCLDDATCQKCEQAPKEMCKRHVCVQAVIFAVAQT